MSATFPIIAIDGVSGAGKTTVSHRVAHRLGFEFLPSGMLYRFMAFLQLKNVSYKEALVACRQLQFHFDENHFRVMHEGEDITQALQSENCSDMASRVIAPNPDIRQDLIPIQHHFCKGKGLVCEGRDMTTVVFPDANLSVYLTASIQVRAQRRSVQIAEQDEGAQEERLLERDRFDKERSVSPLSIHPCSHIIDTSCATCDEVTLRIIQIYQSNP